MMHLILMLLTGATPDLLRLPEHMISPRVHWEDLDQDGQLDIWVSDGRRGLWVWRASEGGDSFKALEFEDIGLTPKPYFDGETLYASVYDQGRTHIYNTHGAARWHSLQGPERSRPGLEPIHTPLGRLTPTYEGYVLAQNNCEERVLKALPAANITEKKLSLTYPIPYSFDLDRDGQDDLLAAPVAFKNRGSLGIWSAMSKDGALQTKQTYVQFSAQLEPMRHQYGDLDGDGYPELTVLAMPSNDMSIFDELTLLVYAGTGPGTFNPVPIQELKTRQNIWQTGPIEMGPEGVRLYYYKGLMKAIFRIDLYAWNSVGYLEPKPKITRWKVKGAERDEIIQVADQNKDGRPDLVLMGKEGPIVYFRTDNPLTPFDKEQRKLLLSSMDGTQIQTQEGTYRFSPRERLRRAHLRRDREIALVEQSGQAPALWTMVENDAGYWYLTRLNKNP